MEKEALKILKFLYKRVSQGNHKEDVLEYISINEISEKLNMDLYILEAKSFYLLSRDFIKYNEANRAAIITKEGCNYLESNKLEKWKIVTASILIPVLSISISLAISIWQSNTAKKIAEESRRKADEANNIAKKAIQGNVLPQIVVEEISLQDEFGNGSQRTIDCLGVFIRNSRNAAYNLKIACKWGDSKLKYWGNSKWDSTEGWRGWGGFKEIYLDSISENAYYKVIFYLPENYTKKLDDKTPLQVYINYIDRLEDTHSFLVQTYDLKKLDTIILK